MFYQIKFKSFCFSAFLFILTTILPFSSASAQQDSSQMFEFEGDLLSQGLVKIYSIKFLENPVIIKKESFPVIDSIAIILLKNPRIRVEVSSYDNLKPGNDEKNTIEKEIQKAKAVCNYLAFKGVTETRFTCKGHTISNNPGSESPQKDSLSINEINTEQDSSNTLQNHGSDSVNVIKEEKQITIQPKERPRIELKIISK